MKQLTAGMLFLLAVCYSTAAVANGTVIDNEPGSDSDGWGRTVLIEHSAPIGKYFLLGDGRMANIVYSLYGHLDSSAVVADQPVKKGDPIGYVGNGYGQYGCHLHFEIQLNSSTIAEIGGVKNPLHYRRNPYAWSDSNRTDGSEFIENNNLMNYTSATDIRIGATITVHPHETGRLLLDLQSPAESQSCNYVFADVWHREGCDYTANLGYSGQIFWKPTNDTGTAKWVPNLPKAKESPKTPRRIITQIDKEVIAYQQNSGNMP